MDFAYFLGEVLCINTLQLEPRSSLEKRIQSFQDLTSQILWKTAMLIPSFHTLYRPLNCHQSRQIVRRGLPQNSYQHECEYLLRRLHQATKDDLVVG